MACRKCGSDWTTKKGRDCQSCPHCNKVQRCVARKQGRWVDKPTACNCKQCGALFSVASSDAGKTQYCSATCRKSAKLLWRAAWRVGYKQGVRKQRHSKRPTPVCRHCGAKFKYKHGGHSSNIYCTKKCFFDARSSGQQSWDKTNIIKAGWHKTGPYSSAPSVTAMKHIARCWKTVSRCQSLFPTMWRKFQSQPKCQTCGDGCNDGASRFCSYSCQKSWRGTRTCKCGMQVDDATAYGRALCTPCRIQGKRQYRRRYKRELGSHRKKVRKGGGCWNSQVRRSVVLARDRYRCYLCKAKCSATWDDNNPLEATVDMVVPASKGGDWDYHNLRCACRRCNSIKSDKLVGQLTLHMIR